MCAIFGSFDIQKLRELAKLNSYRGTHSWSNTVINPVTSEIISQKKGFGEFDVSDIEDDGNYHLCHIQAPTTTLEKNPARIHPSVVNRKMLWHNGILVDSFYKNHPSFDPSFDWDTQVLCNIIESNDSFSRLTDVHGTFSCIYFNTDRWFMFRNAASPMFIDSDLSISSVKADGMAKTLPNMVYTINFNERTIAETFTFNNTSSPYYIR